MAANMMETKDAKTGGLDDHGAEKVGQQKN
jgi:hypothetical protein